jgi:DNA (cytosine-5)-methyltransferase 1
LTLWRTEHPSGIINASMADPSAADTAGSATQPLRVADVFCGAGGLSEGFRQAGSRIAAGSDIDPDACATFGRNFPEAIVICGDIREGEARGGLIEAAAGVDVIVGGPPCQAFSQVRNHVRLLDDPRNSLYREFVRVIASVRPPAFLMENVPGIDQMGVREQIARDLSLDADYIVQSQVVDAADFGVPQTRRRLVFVGIRRSLGIDPLSLSGSGAAAGIGLLRSATRKHIDYAVGSADNSLSTDELLRALADPENLRVVSAAQAISDLAGLPAPSQIDELAANELPEPGSSYQRLMRADVDTLTNTRVPRINADTRKRLRAIPAGGNHRDLGEELLGRYLSGLRWGPDGGTGRLERKHYYAYRRLHPDIWSWTLNTKADSVYHYQRLRALSVREFARLQSFPDRFVITTDPRRGDLPGRIEGGAGHSRYRQVGNAVPPLLAREMAARLREALAAASAAKLVA